MITAPGITLMRSTMGMICLWTRKIRHQPVQDMQENGNRSRPSSATTNLSKQLSVDMALVKISFFHSFFWDLVASGATPVKKQIPKPGHIARNVNQQPATRTR